MSLQQESKNTIFIPGYGMTAPRKKYIASVHFMDCSLNLNHYRRGPYELKAPPKGKVTVLEVTDAQQVKMEAANDNEPVSYGLGIIGVEGIVQDLMKNWAAGFGGFLKGYRPGIMEIAGPEPTEEERKKLMSTAHQFCTQAVAEGDYFHINPSRGRVQQLHRGAHAWLAEGNPAFKIHPWATPDLQVVMKIGAASGQPIPLGARIDGGVDLVEFYLKWNLNPLEFNDTYLAPFVEEQRQAKTPAPTSASRK